MPDTVTIGENGVATSWGKDKVYTGFPTETPDIIATGIATSEVSLLEGQKYMIDIYADYKEFKPLEFPMLTIFENVGGGEIDRNFDNWTNSYEGVDVLHTNINQLRVRDIYGDASASTPTTGISLLNIPLAVSASGEVGGKMIWNNASIAANAAAVYDSDWTKLADSICINVGSPTTKTSQKEIKELAPVANATGEMLLTFGYSRTNDSTNYLTDTIGRVSEFIKVLQNAVSVKKYAGTLYSNVAINGGTPMRFASYVYNENAGSEIVHWIYDYLYEGQADGLTSVVEKHNVHVLVGIKRFMFSEDLKTFIVELDFAESNLDFLLGTDYSGVVTGGAGSITAANGYWQIVQTGAATKDTFPVGKILRVASNTGYDEDGADVSANVTADMKFHKVRTCFLIEERNTAVKVSAVAYRLFAYNEGATRANAAGNTRVSRHIAINRGQELPAPNSELDGFGPLVQGQYVQSQEIFQNFLQIYNADPWAISTMRLNTGLRFKDTFELSRQRGLKAYKRKWSNIFLYGKKANFSESLQNYKGTTSGMLDSELFHIRHLKHPCPVTPDGTTSASGTIHGTAFKRWLEDIAKASNVEESVDMASASKSIFVGIDFINMLTTNAAVIGTNTVNVFGAVFHTPPPSKATLGLQIFEFVCTYGTLRFTREPMLDYTPNLKMPKYMYNSGKLSPRWAAIVVDKNDVSVMSRKGRKEMIYGGLQGNNQPFMVMEGISGAKLFKLRNPEKCMILDMTPNY